LFINIRDAERRIKVKVTRGGIFILTLLVASRDTKQVILVKTVRMVKIVKIVRLVRVI
jgi:hypothetical protein